MGASTSSGQLRAQGMDALKERRYAAAAKLLVRYLDAVPADREAEFALAVARSGEGKHSAALVIFDRLLEKAPPSAALHFNRAMTLERMGGKA
ncbi:MAG TPA: tetratricopeptide repeat protein, partial [Gemmataceae bacterium]|nr:tetratricopeptide repeat protein [Gemmataceae bacterium]